MKSDIIRAGVRRRWKEAVMPLETRMFNWKDKEFRHADEVYLGVVAALTLAMLLGFVVVWF